MGFTFAVNLRNGCPIQYVVSVAVAEAVGMRIKGNRLGQ
jgi:hypothetical protein